MTAPMNDKTARAKADRGTDRLRDEYLDTLLVAPMYASQASGGVAKFGFPSAAELLTGIIDAQPPKVAARPRIESAAKPMRADNPFAAFTAMLDMAHTRHEADLVAARG